MSKRRKTEIEEEKRPLGKYVQQELGITLAQFAKDEEVSRSTLNDRWSRPSGRPIVMDAVECYKQYRLRNEEKRGKKDGI